MQRGRSASPELFSLQSWSQGLPGSPLFFFPLCVESLALLCAGSMLTFLSVDDTICWSPPFSFVSGPFSPMMLAVRDRQDKTRLAETGEARALPSALPSSAKVERKVTRPVVYGQRLCFLMFMLFPVLFASSLFLAISTSLYAFSFFLSIPLSCSKTTFAGDLHHECMRSTNTNQYDISVPWDSQVLKFNTMTFAHSHSVIKCQLFILLKSQSVFE